MIKQASNLIVAKPLKIYEYSKVNAIDIDTYTFSLLNVLMK